MHERGLVDLCIDDGRQHRSVARLGWRPGPTTAYRQSRAICRACDVLGIDAEAEQSTP
jgi:hypothetical protein